MSAGSGTVGRPTADHIALRPLAGGDEAELRRIRETPEVMRWWDVLEPDFPWDEPEATRLTIEVDGAVAGLIQYGEKSDPRYRAAWVDLFLDPALHGRGLGTEAVRRMVHLLIEERGHHRVMIDPAVANTAAIRAYEKAGFRAVGVMRRYERDVGGDGWHDSLLMELLAEDLPDQRPAGSLPAMAKADVTLRDFRPDDAETVHHWFNDERVTEDLVGSRDSFSLEDAARWVERAIDTTRDRKWAITLGDADQAVGFVALFGLDRELGPELAVLVGDPGAWGRGVAREAERLACIEAFRTYGAHRVHAEIPATNAAAQKVVTFLGFRREGVMRRAIRRGSEAVDNEVWGLLPDEFTGWEETDAGG